MRSKDHSIKSKMAYPPKITKEVSISSPEKIALAKYGHNLLIENKGKKMLSFSRNRLYVCGIILSVRRIRQISSSLYSRIGKLHDP